MSLCRFPDHAGMYDVTPLENIFIEEYMLKAPGDYVKVYIYGLKQCYFDSAIRSIADFARALGLEEEVTREAFVYWQRQGLIARGSKDDEFIFLNLKEQLMDGDMGAENTLYHYRDFNTSLQQVFGARLLAPQEFQKAYDWLEVLRLPQEVIIELVAHCLKVKGKRVSMNYIDKVALSWAQENLTSREEAQAFAEASEMRLSGIGKLLKHLGMRRAPTADELALYRKWSEQWGFDLAAIIEASAEMTKINEPNLAYLDRVLSRLHEQQLHGVQDIAQLRTERDFDQGQLVQVLHLLGSRAQSSPELLNRFRMWREELGLPLSVIELAASSLSKSGRSGVEHLNQRLLYWHKQGIRSVKAAQEELDRERQLTDDALLIFERCGETRLPGPADLQMVSAWAGQMSCSFELILQAAEYATGASQKMQFIHKILQNWQAAGITSVAQAKIDHDQRTRNGNAPTGNAIASQFQRHEFSDAQLELLIEDL